MSATYDPTDISTNIVHYARLRFHDTNVAVPLLQDEEYQGLVTRLGNREGLAQAAESLAATFAQKVQTFQQAGVFSTSWPVRPEWYMKLADNIRNFGVDYTSFADLRAGAPCAPSFLRDERLVLS